jgi:drug/metabolite transporter (DMT)-like permease
MALPATRHFLMFAALCLIWGSTWLAMKAGISTIPPGIFSGLRWTLAGGLLAGFLALRGQPIAFPPRLFLRVSMVAMLMIALTATIMLYGLRHVGSGLAAVISCALTPIGLLGFAVATGQERFNPRHFIALALGLAGIAVLFGPKAFAGRLELAEMLGALGVIVGNLTYCLGSVLSRPLMRNLAPVQMAAVTNLIGGVVLLVLSLAFEPGAVAALSLHWPWQTWAAFMFLLVPGSLGASIIYFVLVRDWGASRTGTYAFISPILAVLLGVVIEGETVGLVDAAGMTLMLGAAGVVLQRR